MIKTLKWIPVAVIALGIMASCGGSKQDSNTEVQETQKASVINTTHAYICPMNCENSASMEPGKCKVCGMDLIANPNYQSTDTTAVTPVDTNKAEDNHDDHEGHNH